MLDSPATMNSGVLQVDVELRSLERLASVIAADRYSSLVVLAQPARHLLTDRIVRNIYSTATGGGVAEILQTLVVYGQGAGVDTRWLVLRGYTKFFAITKKLHNSLHGRRRLAG